MKNKRLTTFALAVLTSGLLSPVVSYGMTEQLVNNENISEEVVETEPSNEEILEESTESSTSTEETSTSEVISEPSTSTTEETSESTVDSSTEVTEETTDSSTETSTSTEESSTTETSTSTTETKEKPIKETKPKPKPKPKPQPDKGPKESVKPDKVKEVVASNESASNYSVSSEVTYIKNQSTDEFIESIGDKAREVGQEYGLYASVMIAQAILETGSGSSQLSQAPNHNLFGIKGSYKGQSVSFLTSEDNGKGSLYTIQDSFRKYPSYKESFEDYATLLTDTEKGNGKYYVGTLKKNTTSYKDATKFLTGRYATDTLYDKKLNKLIETYDLTFFDEKLENAGKIQSVYHQVDKNDTVDSIVAKYEISKDDFIKWNKAEKVKELKDNQRVIVGQKKVASYRIRNAKTKQEAEFIVPLKTGYSISSPFGHRGAEHHNGIDLAIAANTPVYASSKGKVAAKGFDPSAGNYIIIEHANGLYTSYFHLNRSAVGLDQSVDMGEMIGYVGSTGNSTGPHLHFGINTELWSGYMNPTNYLAF
ncbi:MAG: peptidoglycan DD-metalloendopeptidase family protein [Vagococcus sp.]|uniref:glucosaminidase domain-containing protein n=1 Tax=Vagococcus TaxID=2737 RepID=UPI002FC65A7B